MDAADYITRKFNPQFTKPYTNIPGERTKELLIMFRDLGFKTGAEIGVEKGIFSESICRECPDVTLYCIDPWKAYPGYREHVTQSKLDGFFAETVKRLSPYKAKIIRKFSAEACKDFDDASLDFIYLDGNHDFLHVTEDLTNWSPKVKSGGIVAGHDFKRYAGKYGQYNHVKDVVPAYASAMGITPWFVLREPKEASSWFWVKPGKEGSK